MGSFPFPFILVTGKDMGISLKDNSILDVNHAKEVLFSQVDLLPYVTGYFFLSIHDGEGLPVMKIQLRPKCSIDDMPNSLVSNFLIVAKKEEFQLEFIPYDIFPVSMELSLDRKLIYS